MCNTLVLVFVDLHSLVCIIEITVKIFPLSLTVSCSFATQRTIVVDVRRKLRAVYTYESQRERHS
jgi:hypothetical protein